MQFSEAKLIFLKISSTICRSHGCLIRAIRLMPASAWRCLPEPCLCVLFFSHGNIYYLHISNACNFIHLCSLKRKHLILFTVKEEAWERQGGAVGQKTNVQQTQAHVSFGSTTQAGLHHARIMQM